MQAENQITPITNSEPKPLKSVEGWIIIVTNIHEQSMEDDIYDTFSNHGQVKSIHLNLDRRTGYAKGYALIQFMQYQQAEEAIKQMNGTEMLGKNIQVDWAFKTAPIKDKQNK